MSLRAICADRCRLNPARFPPWARFSCVRARLHVAGAVPCPRPWIFSAVTSGEDVALAGDDGANEALLTVEGASAARGCARAPRVRRETGRTIGPSPSKRAFSVEVGGVSVQGRIDAVFKRMSGEGQRFLVVDWKSGRRLRVRRSPKLAYFAFTPVPACMGCPHGRRSLRGRRDGRSSWQGRRTTGSRPSREMLGSAEQSLDEAATGFCGSTRRKEPEESLLELLSMWDRNLYTSLGIYRIKLELMKGVIVKCRKF